MNETNAVIEARNQAYRVVSWVLLAITLLVLVGVGLGLPLFYLPPHKRMWGNMGSRLPMITQFIIDYSRPVLCLLGTGLIGTMLVMKEFLATPKMRLWINVVTLAGLLIWGACYFYAISLPTQMMLEAMSNS